MQDKYGFFEIQKKIQEWWDKNNIYQTKKKSNTKEFVIDTPPPTVSGKLHIGHIFSYTHQDFIARYHRMNGKRVIYPFGFDDNGLPTERYVEKKRGTAGHKHSRAEFINICLEEIKPLHDSFVQLWKTMGLSCDWNLVYSTISEETKKISQESFIDLYEKGYIYKKLEPALYCTAMRTSISQADLEEVEKKSTLNTILFNEIDSGETLPIATTRPELLGGCVAVLVHPEDHRYSHLVGKKAKVPLYNHIVTIIADELVIPEKGTGIVLSATFGDTLDVAWFKKHSFEYKKILNNDGTISSLGLFLEGLKVEEARKKVIEKLKEENLLIEEKEILHRVSIYERSKKEVEYLMLNQWFVSILPYKEKFIELGNTIKWYPEHMKYRYDDWVKNLSWDWCISRQRSFGIPFPVWYTPDGGIIIADKKELPLDPLLSKPQQYLGQVEGDGDVMDTWNTSSITPLLIQGVFEKVYQEKLEFPFSMRPQSHDIIRTWAFDTIVKSFFHTKTIPWDNIVISGHVLSASNEKISKSKGNSSMEPEQLFAQYPADVVRYWAAQAKLGVDTAFSETQFKEGNRLIVKLMNAAICIKDFAIFSDSTNHNYSTSNFFAKYFLSSFEKMKREYHQAFSRFEFSTAMELIEKFFWLFCDHFLEIIKTYQNQENNERRELQNITGSLFKDILIYFSPFIPFTTEHLFQTYWKSTQSIHTLQFSGIVYAADFVNKDEGEIFLEIINILRKIKSELKVSLKTPIQRVLISFEKKEQGSFFREKLDLLGVLEKLLIIEKVSIVDYGQKNKLTNIPYSYTTNKEEIEEILLHI